eukprot:COSAG01_NODE_20097_length_970_cov_3.787600_2_plen_33_part_01
MLQSTAQLRIWSAPANDRAEHAGEHARPAHTAA